MMTSRSTYPDFSERNYSTAGRSRKTTKRLSEFVDTRTAVGEDGDPDYEVDADEDAYEPADDSDEDAEPAARRCGTILPYFHNLTGAGTPSVETVRLISQRPELDIFVEK